MERTPIVADFPTKREDQTKGKLTLKVSIFAKNLPLSIHTVKPYVA